MSYVGEQGKSGKNGQTPYAKFKNVSKTFVFRLVGNMNSYCMISFHYVHFTALGDFCNKIGLENSLYARKLDRFNAINLRLI